MGVRRQGLEPRTVALREPAGRFLDLRRIAGVGSDLGVCLPLLSAGNPGLPVVRGPSAAQGRARGGHGRRESTWLRRGSDGNKLSRRVSPTAMTTSLVGKLPEAARQLRCPVAG
jgi:hypothetical protein